MRRTATEILRRGFENMLANWPLLAIRIAESFLLVAIAITAVLAIVVPFLVSLGLDRSSMPSDPSEIAGAILNGLASHWLIIVYAFVVVSIVLLVFIAVHAFVAAGCALIYIDGERKTARIVVPARAAFQSFSGDRWFRGGRAGWWPVFWIYNIAWSVGGLVMLLPLFFVLAAVIILRGSAAAAATAGCLGAMISILFIILVAIVTNVWTEKAIVDCVARDAGAMVALRSSWNELRTDAGRHIAVAVVMMAVTLAGSMVFSTFSMFGSMSHNAGFNIMLMPMQFSASIANAIFSAAVGAWFLASFAALAVESRP